MIPRPLKENGHIALLAKAKILSMNPPGRTTVLVFVTGTCINLYFRLRDMVLLAVTPIARVILESDVMTSSRSAARTPRHKRDCDLFRHLTPDDSMHAVMGQTLAGSRKTANQILLHLAWMPAVAGTPSRLGPFALWRHLFSALGANKEQIKDLPGQASLLA